MWNIYIIECSDKKLYTGITKDIDRRLKEHSSGHGGRFTKFRGPVKLMFQQQMADKPEAMRREVEIKKMSRREKEELVRSFSFSRKVETSGQFFA